VHSKSLPTEVRHEGSDRVFGDRPVPGSASRGSIRGGITEGRDGEVVDRLAVLSGRTPPSGAVLFAELGGKPVAAIGIFDGNVVADRTRSNSRLRMRLRLERLLVRAVIAVREV
jgi:hypothetical protein